MMKVMEKTNNARNKEMKAILTKTLLDSALCNESGVEVLIGIIERKAIKMDRCGNPDCDHEHIIPIAVKMYKKEKATGHVNPKSRMDIDKENILRQRGKGG